MNKFIFNQTNEQSGTSTAVYYTMYGEHEALDELGNPIVTEPNKSKALAYKTQKVNGDHRYMIRTNYSKKLYNPLSIYGKDKSFNLLDNITRSNIEYKEVNSNAFAFYLKFLSSKNIAWLNKAEREI